MFHVKHSALNPSCRCPVSRETSPAAGVIWMWDAGEGEDSSGLWREEMFHVKHRYSGTGTVSRETSVLDGSFKTELNGRVCDAVSGCFLAGRGSWRMLAQ